MGSFKLSMTRIIPRCTVTTSRCAHDLSSACAVLSASVTFSVVYWCACVAGACVCMHVLPRWCRRLHGTSIGSSQWTSCQGTVCCAVIGSGTAKMRYVAHWLWLCMVGAVVLFDAGTCLDGTLYRHFIKLWRAPACKVWCGTTCSHVWPGMRRRVYV